jgi:hypothetical protein
VLVLLAACMCITKQLCACTPIAWCPAIDLVPSVVPSGSAVCVCVAVCVGVARCSMECGVLPADLMPYFVPSGSTGGQGPWTPWRVAGLGPTCAAAAAWTQQHATQ